MTWSGPPYDPAILEKSAFLFNSKKKDKNQGMNLWKNSMTLFPG